MLGMGEKQVPEGEIWITGQTEIWVWVPALEEAHRLAKPMPVKWCPEQRKSQDPTGLVIPSYTFLCVLLPLFVSENL